MNAIPGGHRADEFALSVEWQGYGSRPGQGVVPGFYLRAVFANEGTAVSALGHSADYRERLLMQPGALTAMLWSLDPWLPVNLSLLAKPLNIAAQEAQEARLNALRAQIRSAQGQIEAAERALRAEGVEPS